jgi:hypothetical protein
VSYQGRIIVFEGDMLLDADNILRGMDEAVEKGTTSRFWNANGQELSKCSGANPLNVFECPAGSNYMFWRPYIGNPGYYVVVNSSYQYNFDIVEQAATTIENLNFDSIGSHVFNVIKSADYNALPQATRDNNYKIDVVITSSACGINGSSPTALACMLPPGISCQQLATGQPCVPRMRLGSRMGINSARIMTNTVTTQGIIIHEFLHGLGLHHFNYQVDTSKLYVPGTIKPTRTDQRSIMWASLNDAGWSPTLQSDDIDTVQTLYQSGTESYFHHFSVVTAP